MGQDIKIIPLKVTFTKDGPLGDGSYAPLRVTLDQLAEIWYRVKDSKITACDISFEDQTMLFQDGTLPSPNSTSDGAEYPTYCDHGIRVGYIDGEIDPKTEAWADTYFGEGYLVPNPFPDPETEPTIRDILTGELGIWSPDPSVTSGCGMSHSLGWYPSDYPATDELSPPSGYAVYATYTTAPEPPDPPVEYFTAAGFSVYFIPMVSWAGADSPFSPDAELWAWVSVDLSVASIFSGALSLSSYNDGSASYVGDLELALSSEVLTVKLYTTSEGVAFNENPRLSAIEWWPYKNGVTGGPVWNTFTGEKL